MKHGTTTGYSYHRCRCDLCRAAVAEYRRKYDIAQRAGTYVPRRKGAQRVPCTGPECDLLARYRQPQPLCLGHKQMLVRTGSLRPLRRKNFVKDGMKLCGTCDRFLPIDEFHKQRDRPTSKCKSCLAIYSRARRYGLTFAAMAELMKQPCAGCGVQPDGRSLHIDHCHETGRVRGLLCNNCNAVLTKHMTPARLRRLADYLES